MAKVDTPDLNFIFNPAAYSQAHAETKKAKDRGHVRESRKPPFAKFLENANVQETEAPETFPISEETLQTLLDDVHSSGDELKSRPFPDEIIRYKKAVRNFIHYVVENSYTLEEKTSGANLLRRKKFTLVQVVDKKLEQLAAGIMAGQTNQLELLARIDEIAGILVNLLR
ncbi:MAG: DUF327 family protein [Spirochaetaceae bacterium]|jgi:uncharacterized protein YaaR (DUF327 family)|nr:DUF327 family protein [Spirochaetaceae bacterium]